MVKIKICGMTSAPIAYQAAHAGADFIGLLFVPGARRAVRLDLATAVAQAARDGGAIPVAVFTDASADTMLATCEKTNIQWVQLHGTGSREAHEALPDDFHRIYVHPVSPNGFFTTDNAVDRLDIARDYLLFDALKPGSGETFNWENFSYTEKFPWFLSGGLNPQNVRKAIRRLHPTVVDVSSGVESAGEKSMMLITQFMTAVKAEEEKA
jgi:phosphoribosylanthranilate isomerase